MQSIHIAAGAIQMNAGEAFICAGVESMSRIPVGGFNPMPNADLYERNEGAYMAMGETAENLAQKYQIPREEQEQLAVSSHAKATAAREEGRFADEIVPVDCDGETIDQDGCIRPGTNLEKLASLEPAFDAEGTVTAATSSPLTDGAAAVLVCTEEFAAANKLDVLASIKSIAVAGCQPEIMGYGPVVSTAKALERAGIRMSDIDVIELNEAFAVQALACVRELSIDLDKMNLDGGAVALGHPLGATGARITGKAAQLLKREGKKYALATQCIGGGQGISTILEAA
jgi:acetyl-CoA acyltransferase